MKFWTIGKAARVTGCSIETLRYYERIGLAPGPPRTAGGHRLYSEVHLHRLALIRGSRALGFSVTEIRALLGLVDGGAFTCDEVKTLVLGRLQDVRAKLEGLKVIESMLLEMAGRCSGGPASQCAFVDGLSDIDACHQLPATTLG